MSAAELLAQLTPHGVRIGHIPGGIANLTPQDVANATAKAKLTPYEHDIVRLVYCLDLDKFASVCNWVYIKEGTKHWALRKLNPRPEIVRDFCTFTTYETLFLGRCPRCHGAGVHQNQKDCALCDGTGHYFHDDKWVAEYVLEIPAEHFEKSRIKERRRQISYSIKRTEASAVQKIEEVLGRESDWWS